MTTVVQFDGAGLTDGHSIAAADAGTGDTAVAAINGTAPVVDGDDTPHGQPGERAFLVDNNGVNSYFTLSYTPIEKQRCRFYFKTPSAWAASAMNCIFSLHVSSGGRRTGIALAGTGNPGELRILDGSTTISATDPDPLALATWYRCEMWADFISASSWVVGFAIWGIDGTKLWDSGNIADTVHPNGAAPGVVYVGPDNASPRVQMAFAHVKLTDDNATEIGPWYTPPTGKVLRRYNGTSEVLQVVRRYNGTSEVAMSVDRT